MPSQSRKADQAVDAFSAPVSLIERAKREAANRHMTKSGFYRYCLAKECGFSEKDATDMALHRGLYNSIEAARESAQSARLNEKPNMVTTITGDGNVITQPTSSYPKPKPRKKN